jgi:DNA-binding NarL/FixJ family response regulator
MDATAKTRIVLIEDHPILRDGLRGLLDLEPEFEVVGEAGSAAEGRQVAASMEPDLVITDIKLPDGSGLDIIPDLKRQSPEVRVLVLTGHYTDEYVRSAIAKGADGYVLKDASRLEFIEGIRTVLSGRRFFSSSVASFVVAAHLVRRNVAEKTNVMPITRRETQILRLVALAHTSKSIAADLNLSVKTVQKHRSNLMRKLDLHNRAAVTRYAIQHQLVSEDLVGRALGITPGEHGCD